MKIALLGIKGLILLFWIAATAALTGFLPEAYRSPLGIMAGLILGLHVLELVFVANRLIGDLPDRKYHQVMILLFGIAHMAGLIAGGQIKWPPKGQ